MSALPKFLFADDADDASSPHYIVHTQEPRFIARCGETGTVENAEPNLTVHWLDDSAETYPAAELRELMQKAAAYYRRAMDE